MTEVNLDPKTDVVDHVQNETREPEAIEEDGDALSDLSLNVGPPNSNCIS